jgi:putative chitinase
MIDVRAVQTALRKAGQQIDVDGDWGPLTLSGLFAFVGRGGPTVATTGLGRAAELYFPGAALITPLRIAHALARWAVETRGFRQFEESLDYTAERLVEVWPKRFPTTALALPYAHNPHALANKTYGGRMGNTGPDDGWLYRGRGVTQLTGKDEYAEATHLTGVDVLSQPDLVSGTDTGLRVACAYWTARHVNAHADLDDVEGVCVAINGGQQGLDLQRQYLTRAKLVLQ